MATLDVDALARELADYQLVLSRPQLRLVRAYLELLLRWNRRLRLTGLRAPGRIVRELFCESLYLTRVVPLAGRVVDIGSGAGFPGLALKVVVPELNVVLVEANHRKCVFLNEVVRHLHLSEVVVFTGRFEDYARGQRGSCDLATTRAVRVGPQLVEGVEAVLGGGGKFAAFTTRELAGELVGLASRLEWGSAVALPRSRRRVILVGRKRV